MENLKQKETIVVWFSCGAASAVAAKLTVQRYSKTHHVRIVNNPVDEEGDDNRRFLKDVEQWIGYPIEIAINTELRHTSAVRVWEQRKYMAGIKGAPCTLLLKKSARYEFERKNKVDWHVLGFTSEEKHRHERFIKSERSNVIPVLIDDGLTKKDCYKIVENAGIRLPEAYQLGLPNANCFGCPKATSSTYWNKIREVKPETFNQRATMSRDLGVKLVRYKGKRIFLDELPADAKGRKIKSYECGIFCDTK